MSTTAIIIIVVLVLIVLAILFATILSPKARKKRALDKERTQAAEQHREVASKRETEAELAERQATERRREAERAEHEAAQRRLDAEQHNERADLHEEGRMDHELDHGPDAPREDERGLGDRARDAGSDTSRHDAGFRDEGRTDTDLRDEGRRDAGLRDDARGETGRPTAGDDPRGNDADSLRRSETRPGEEPAATRVDPNDPPAGAR